MPVRNRENDMSSQAVHIVATNTEISGGGDRECERQRAERAIVLALLFEPVFDGDATCFVGTSARRSVLSEGKRGRKVLVTGGT
jgi:hypothetical protein